MSFLGKVWSSLEDQACSHQSVKHRMVQAQKAETTIEYETSRPTATRGLIGLALGGPLGAVASTAFQKTETKKAVIK